MFAPVNDDTVQDGDGNQYWFPFASASGAPPNQVPVLPPSSIPSPDAGQPSPPVPQPTPQPVPQDPYAGPASALPSDWASPFTLSSPPPATVPVPTNPTKPTPEQQRQAALSNDIAGYAAAGGTPRSDEDMSRIAGGIASHKAETAKAEAALTLSQGEAKIARDKQLADLAMDYSNQYAQRAAAIDAQAHASFLDWKKRSDEAAKQLVDPRHAFTSMSTSSKIGWALDFLGAGLAGGGSVSQVQGHLNNLIEADIGAQKYNITNKREALQQERIENDTAYKQSRDGLADWYAAKQLRLKAVGQQLDAEIAKQGLPAATAAGLLQARDAIEGEVAKTEQGVANHYFEDGEKKKGFAHEEYMARLNSALRVNEDQVKAGLKTGDRGDSLPTGTTLGLQSTHKGTGQLETGGIPIKVKGEKAVEAGQVLSSANKEATLLSEVEAELGNMSNEDIARGGSAKFKAIVADLVQARAVRDNGHKITDEDVYRAARAQFGVEGMGTDKILSNTSAAIKSPGEYKNGIIKAIQYHRKNLARETENSISPYVDTEYAQTHDIHYNPTAIHPADVSDKPDDLNTAILKAAGGAKVDDLLTPPPRKPVTKDEEKPPAVEAADSLQYSLEKKAGRGAQNGLPVLPEREETKVSEATQAFDHATVDNIIALSKSYLRNAGLSEEAKHEIRMEAQLAIGKSSQIEQAVMEEATSRYNAEAAKDVATSNYDYGTHTGHGRATDISGNYTKDFEQYLKSGILDELRKRAGLVPRNEVRKE